MVQSVGSEVITLGPWGGSGGEACESFIATDGIVEITIYSGEVIDSISFKDANGNNSGKFGGGSPDNNDWGTKHKIIINWPSEYLKSISGSYSEFQGRVVIDSLSFITNQTIYGPFGTTHNTSQAFSIPIDGSVVVGFHGRAGYYIDALGIYVQPINPSGSVSVGPWGGKGGDAFGFKVDPSYIKHITVSYGECIHFISFKDGNDHEYGPYGKHHPNASEKTIEIDGNSQRLTSISGTYGNYKGFTVITSLSFVVNSTKYGPYGSETGTAFSIPMKGSEVVGFYGSSGWYLDLIGLYVKPVINNRPVESISK